MNDGDAYRNPDLLWSRDTLLARLDDPSLRLIDVRPGERFAMGHIPGARHFDIYAVNCDDTDDAPLQSFTRMWAFLLARRGVSFDDTIVFCGEITGMTAARGIIIPCTHLRAPSGERQGGRDTGTPEAENGHRTAGVSREINHRTTSASVWPAR